MLPSQGLSSGAIGYLHDVDQPDTVHLVVVNSLDVAIKDVQASEGLQAKYRLNSKETNKSTVLVSNDASQVDENQGHESVQHPSFSKVKVLLVWIHTLLLRVNMFQVGSHYSQKHV